MSFLNKLFIFILLAINVILAVVIFKQHQRIVYLENQVTDLITESFSRTEPIILEDL